MIPVFFFVLALFSQLQRHLRSRVESYPRELNPEPAQVHIQITAEHRGGGELRPFVLGRVAEAVLLPGGRLLVHTLVQSVIVVVVMLRLYNES